MAEANHSAEAEDEIQAHRREGEDHDASEQVEVEGLVERGRQHGHEGEHGQADRAGDEGRADASLGYPPRAGKRPWGRKKRTAAIRR